MVTISLEITVGIDMSSLTQVTHVYSVYNFLVETNNLLFFSLMSNSQIDLRAYGSTPAVGSSRITVLAFPQKAMATDSFLFIPPDNHINKSMHLNEEGYRTAHNFIVPVYVLHYLLLSS